MLRGTLAHLEIIGGIDARPAAEIRAGEGKLSDPASLITPVPNDANPKIDFTYLPESPKAGEPSLIYVNYFDDAQGILVDMNWEIDGDAGARGPVLLHVFDSPGPHNVALTVTDDLGAKGNCEKTIQVK